MARKLAVRLHWMWRKGSKYQRAVEFVSHLSIEKLKQKWAAFTTGIIDVISAEEIKIGREEFDQQIETRTRWLAHFKYSEAFSA
jgi:hypothetical protein